MSKRPSAAAGDAGKAGKPWYAAGLRFTCVPECGRCCTLHENYAYVYLDSADEQAMSEFIHELKVPNEKYLEIGFEPILERNPLRFWKLIAAALVVSQMVSVYFLTK